MKRDISTDSEPLLRAIGKLITPCSAQRVAVEIVELPPDNDSLTASAQGQSVILTANLPVPTAENPPSELPEYWFNYLPTNGSDKHLLAMWLHHLCWQIARHTTSQQVETNDGMALWQFSNVKLVYLAPIAYPQARAYLQDLLMLWQLAQRTVVVLPPALAIAYIKAFEKDDEAKREKAIQDIYKKWTALNFNSQYISDDCALHPTWQFLLGETASVGRLEDCLTTLGITMYQPLVTAVRELG